MVQEDGTVSSIYCHWDGYPENNGRLLREHWDDAYLVEHLIALGDLSYLSKEIGEKQDFDNPTDDDWCLAYMRDRGEKGKHARGWADVDSFIHGAPNRYCADYIYLWQDGMWRCWDYEGKHINLYDMNVEA
jgi:hypothetical protein